MPGHSLIADAADRSAVSGASRMLFLMLQLGGERYALDASQVAEVLPLVSIRRIPQSVPSVAGVIIYRDAPVPVIDLCKLILDETAPARLSTRIVLVHYRSVDSVPRLLGLMAEKVTETSRRNPADFVPSGVTNAGVPYLGPVATDAKGLIQRIEVSRLLPATLRDSLFREAADL